MATLGRYSSSPPRRRKSLFRNLERYCCACLTYFPLVFVYGLTSWAVWVQASLNISNNSWGYTLAFIGIILYLMLNWCYTVGVFTDPGSPLTSGPEYHTASAMEAQPSYSSLTVKSSGEMRFCKKCQAKKPDRAHHCSTCRRCVLKMDHHCPWLATCVGLRNYKAFLLFLIYTCLFCVYDFAVTFFWVYEDIIIGGAVEESMMPVNYILLCVIAGIIALVLGGFTFWHIWLTRRGTTTIETLEKTRYLNPLRKQMQSHLSPDRTYVDDEHHSFGEQLRDLGGAVLQSHANALPGVLRPEEGEERMSPAQSSLRNQQWADQEAQRERELYNEYMEEEENERLPNAFDLGWRKNLLAVMGPDPWLWFFPIMNSVGDGWTWETSQAWHEATEKIAREKIARQRQDEWRSQPGHRRHEGWAPETPTRHDSSMSHPPRSNGRLGQGNSSEDGDDYDSSSDEGAEDSRARLLRNQNQALHPGTRLKENWNDLPEDMVNERQRGSRGNSRSRRGL